MIEMATVSSKTRLRKEDYEDYKVSGPDGVNASFWTALTEALGCEPWAELVIIKGYSVTAIGDLDK